MYKQVWPLATLASLHTETCHKSQGPVLVVVLHACSLAFGMLKFEAYNYYLESIELLTLHLRLYLYV